MKRIKGFTLMELVITMSIVIILSLISWPIYRSYHLKEVSMLGEGYALLGAIKDAQIHYYNEYGYFLGCAHLSGGRGDRESSFAWTSNDPILGINVMNNRYFSKFNAYDGVNYYYDSRPYAFTAVVVGKIGKGNNDTVKLIMPYNLTIRYDLTVVGSGNTTIGGWGH